MPPPHAPKTQDRQWPCRDVHRTVRVQWRNGILPLSHKGFRGKKKQLNWLLTDKVEVYHEGKRMSCLDRKLHTGTEEGNH